MAEPTVYDQMLLNIATGYRSEPFTLSKKFLSTGFG
jgi:hypothetical protein